jgi:glycyl-tRNA synthetase
MPGVSHFKDIRYTDSIAYGEMFMQNEFEMGRYNLDVADVETQRKRFDLCNTVLLPRISVDQGTAMQHPQLLAPAPDQPVLAIPLQEAKRLLEQRLPIPAYDHLLKLLHVFNVLDARGAVGVTERQACFATLRALARHVTGGDSPPTPTPQRVSSTNPAHRKSG